MIIILSLRGQRVSVISIKPGTHFVAVNVCKYTNPRIVYLSETGLISIVLQPEPTCYPANIVIVTIIIISKRRRFVRFEGEPVVAAAAGVAAAAAAAVAAQQPRLVGLEANNSGAGGPNRRITGTSRRDRADAFRCAPLRRRRRLIRPARSPGRRHATRRRRRNDAARLPDHDARLRTH